jgi:hypothetical protein
MGPRGSLDCSGEEEIGTPNSDLSVIQPVANRYTDWAIPSSPDTIYL